MVLKNPLTEEGIQIWAYQPGHFAYLTEKITDIILRKMFTGNKFIKLILEPIIHHLYWDLGEYQYIIYIFIHNNLWKETLTFQFKKTRFCKLGKENCVSVYVHVYVYIYTYGKYVNLLELNKINIKLMFQWELPWYYCVVTNSSILSNI